jgi:hypothetical protein
MAYFQNEVEKTPDVYPLRYMEDFLSALFWKYAMTLPPQ